MDILSAKKARKHGMCDERWTIKHKSIQYKGLVNLYKRDIKISTRNVDKFVKLNKQEIARLTKKIKTKKENLDNAMNAEKLKLDNLLIPNKQMRLICQRLPAEAIMERIKQTVYSERKRLDIMKCGRDKKESELIALKLHASDLEDRLHKKFTNKSMMRTTKTCENITGRIQDTNLLLEAAISVTNCYKIVRHLLNRDSIFFTQLLLSLQGDKLRQNRCMMQAVFLGQIAIENLHDKKIDFGALRLAVDKASKTRNEDIYEANMTLKYFPRTLKMLIRKDDEKALSFNNKKHAEELQDMSLYLEKDLTLLKNKIMVSHFEDILPRLVTQDTLESKLNDLLLIQKKNHKKLSTRVNQGKTALEIVSHSEYEDTQNYFDKKKFLEDEIDKNILKAEYSRKTKDYYSKILADIKIIIENIRKSCEVVENSGRVEKLASGNSLLDAICYIIYKIKCLMTSDIYDQAATITLSNEADEYEEFMKTRLQIDLTVDEEEEEDELFVDNTVLTYVDIKEQSRQIVEYYKNLHEI